VAVKIVRQANRIILLGSPTSAAAASAGHEGAPSALRSAGLVDRFRAIGYEVEDFGDDPVQITKPDEESPRARNISGVLAALNALKPRVEAAVKAAALPVVLSGDCSAALATIAGVRRYFRAVGLIYMDRDADLNTPATTKSGALDGMVVSHITGRGAAELVRFWSEPPLVRDPDVALFGVARLDAPEQELMERSMLRRYLASDVQRTGVEAAARTALERIHADKNEFVLHFDVDAIGGFAATDFPDEGGLTLDQVREALEVFVAQPHLAAVEVAGYNPAKDADGGGARQIIDLLAGALAKRLEALKSAAPVEDKTAAEPEHTSGETAAPALAPSAAETGSGIATAVPPAGEAWSSDTDGDESGEASPSDEAGNDSRESPGDTEGSGA
jgi:arginase